MRKKLQKILLKTLFFSIFFAVSSNFSFAKSKTNVSFSDKSICEENQGVWREFGNDCTDLCRPKFDTYYICAKSVTFSCDCGADKCWQDGKCVEISKYRQTFKTLEEKQKEELLTKKKEREEKINGDASFANYMKNLYQQQKQAAAAQASTEKNQKSAPKPINQTTTPTQQPNAAQTQAYAPNAQLPTQPKIQQIPPGYVAPKPMEENGLALPIVPIPQ